MMAGAACAPALEEVAPWNGIRKQLPLVRQGWPSSRSKARSNYSMTLEVTRRYGKEMPRIYCWISLVFDEKSPEKMKKKKKKVPSYMPSK